MKANKLILIISLILVLLSAQPIRQTLAAPPQQDELNIISYPGNNQVVRGMISVTGSAVHPNFQRYQIAYAVEPVNNNNQWVTIGAEKSEQVVNGELAVWDTTALPDGSYSLRLRVIRLDGNYSEIEVQHIVVANTQPADTPTPEGSPTPATPEAATVTPTPLEPTPTILIEVPVETATPRPLTVTNTLPTPRPDGGSMIPIPKVSMDTSSIKGSCLAGAGGILALFLFFGFLSAIRLVILGFAKRIRK